MANRAHLPLLLLAVACSDVSAAPLPLRSICSPLSMQPFPAINTSLGEGAVYLKTNRRFSPSTVNLMCSNVFQGMDASATTVKGTAYIGEEKVERSKSGSLGLSLLAGIIGPANSGKLDASLSKGDKWTVKTGPIETAGQNALGTMQFVASDNKCFQNIRRVLGNKGFVEVLLVPQVARTESINYTVNGTSGGSGGPDISLASLVTVKLGVKVENKTDSALSLTGKPFNICYAAPTRVKLRHSMNVGPREFILEP